MESATSGHPSFSDGKKRKVSGGSFLGEESERGSVRDGDVRLALPRDGEAASGPRFRCCFKRGCEQHDGSAVVLSPVPTCCRRAWPVIPNIQESTEDFCC